MIFQVIKLCPYLIANGTYSSSKMIGEILMPAFLTKNEDVQREIARTIPALVCMSLGSYSIVLTLHENNIGHPIFSSDTIKMSLMCSKCHNSSNFPKETENYFKELQREYIEIHSNILDQSLGNHSIISGLKALFAKFLNFKLYTNLEYTGYWDLFGWLCHHYYVFNYGVSMEVINEENWHFVLQGLRIYNNYYVVRKYISFLLFKF